MSENKIIEQDEVNSNSAALQADQIGLENPFTRRNKLLRSPTLKESASNRSSSLGDITRTGAEETCGAVELAGNGNGNGRQVPFGRSAKTLRSPPTGATVRTANRRGSTSGSEPQRNGSRIQTDASVKRGATPEAGGSRDKVGTLSRRRSSRVSVTTQEAGTPQRVASAEKDPQTSGEDARNTVDRTAVMTDAVGDKVAPESDSEHSVASAISALRIRIDQAEKAAEERMRQMKALMRIMLDTLAKQPNVSRSIKEALPKMEDVVEGFEEDRKALSSAGHDIAELALRQARGASTGRGRTFAEVAAGVAGKRTATSPPLIIAAKRVPGIQEHRAPVDPKAEDADGFTVVRRKKKGKKKRKRPVGREAKASGAQGAKGAKTAQGPKDPKTKPSKRRKNKRRVKADAIALKPAEGKTYADVLGTIRKGVRPEACGAEVRAIRRTRNGDMLLELGKTTDEARKELMRAITEAVGENGSARELIPRVSLEIRDLDCCTTQQEVEEAVRGVLQSYHGHLCVTVTRPNAREQCAAIVALEEAAAAKILKETHIRIGWVRCRVRQRVDINRCFKCLGFGHRSRECKGPDRSGLCYKCGGGDHKAASCKANPRCYLCEAGGVEPQRRDHIAGSGTCKVFRELLTKARR